MSEWMQVESKATGRRLWARVSKSSVHSDDSYSSWREPKEYEITAGKLAGLVIEPDLDSYRQTYSVSEFHQLFRLIKERG